MDVSTISLGLPCFTIQTEQTRCSFWTRITLAALGAIVCLIGVLGLAGVLTMPIAAGASLVVIGALFLLAGFCVRCVNEGGKYSARGKEYEIQDPRVGWSSGGSTTIGGVTTEHRESYCTLETFLSSEDPEDIALKHRLTQELAIGDLPQRLQENFSNDAIGFALPLNYVNDVRDDEMIFNTLKLIYLSKQEILELPLEEVKKYKDEERNILSLRLNYIQSPIPKCAAGTFGAFLNFRVEIVSDEVPFSLYAFFTKSQLWYFLNTKGVVNQDEVVALFPSSDHLPFTTLRSQKLLLELDLDKTNQILPFVTGEPLWSLIKKKGDVLDSSRLTDQQINGILPCDFMNTSKTSERMEKLSIETINNLLSVMHGQLKYIPSKHLKNSKLNLRSLPEEKIRRMFPVSFMEKSDSLERTNQLARDQRAYVHSIVNFKDLFL